MNMHNKNILNNTFYACLGKLLKLHQAIFLPILTGILIPFIKNQS